MITNKFGSYGKAQNANQSQSRKIEVISILLLSLGYVQVAVLHHSTISVIVRLCLTLIVATIFILNINFFKTVKFKKKGLVLAFGFY